MPIFRSLLLYAAALSLVACSEKAYRPEPTGQVRKSTRDPVTAAAKPATNAQADQTSLTTDAAPVAAPQPVPDPDEEHRDQIVGVWKQFETGVRWLDVRPDGTARMFIDPDWIAKAVIGDGLTIEIDWSIDDGRVLMRSVAGRPETTFKAVSALYGRDRDRPIVELDDENFVMLDEDDGEMSKWTRVSASEQLPAALRN